MSALAEDHTNLLAMASEVFRLERRLNKDMEDWDQHGAACDRLRDELRRQLSLTNPSDIPALPSPQQEVKSIRKEAFKNLKERLPQLIEEAIGSLE